MRQAGARMAAMALALAALCSPPVPADAAALGLNIGPFHIGLPFFGRHRGHRHGTALHARREAARPVAEAPVVPDRSESVGGQPSRSDVARERSPNLLYPVLAWPSIYGDIFSPEESTAKSPSWPFSYEGIFGQAFATYRASQVAGFCQRENAATDIVQRIKQTIKPTAEQDTLLQRLGEALGQASGYLIKSCPNTIPPHPVARLQLMEGQVDAMIMALEVVRLPLQAFEQSLTQEQQAQLTPAGAANETQSANIRDTVAADCNATPQPTSWPISLVEKAVRPSDAQRNALSDVEQAFDRAESDLRAYCGLDLPSTALGRLQALEARLDATWRAVQTIQVALAHFENQLNDQQSIRFNAMKMAATQ
jgi:hypothetical protein